MTRTLILLLLILTPVSAGAITQAEVKQTGGGVEVISGICKGMIGVGLADVTTKCNCMQKFPGSYVGRNGTVFGVQRDRLQAWSACMGAH